MTEQTNVVVTAPRSSKKITLLKGAAIVLAACASPAFATEAAPALDVSAATTILSGITAAVAAIGVAKLAPAATSVAFKWAKGALFS
ncbi:major capsid protein [Photobacterium leiognathi]|uniref:major capsid protein n=1 Tax=Photobacterium leiognathi TaxID=553611 RepID=UPI00273A50DE|nr:major capsid protein [Photobacterium leiognathi]